MTEGETELTQEVSRIVACPYPASCAKLAGILARSDALTIRACIRSLSPCAIAKLANIVYAGLPQWQYTVSILQSLSHSPEFREKLLLQQHGLLDALLTKANSSQHAFEEYAQLCVTLLSGPLPERIPLPTSAQLFFLRMFDEATGAPEVGTLRPIYHMLNGACKGFFNLVAPRTREKFDEELCKILSSKSAGKSALVTLWCFGIAILIEHPDAASKVRISDSSSGTPALPLHELKWKTATGRKVFDATNGCIKTVNMAYLSVILATKGGDGISDTEALEAIRIATLTLHFIDQKGREQWSRSSNVANSTFQKLPLKIQLRDDNPLIQLEALGVYAMVAATSDLPLELVNLYGTILTRLTSLGSTDSLKEALSTSMLLFAPHMPEPSVRSLLIKVFESSISPSPTLEMSNCKVLVDELAAIVPTCPEFRLNILRALSTNDLKHCIQKFLQLDAHCFENVPAQYCRPYSAALHGSLVSATLSLLLITIVTSRSEEPTLPHALGIALITKQQQFPSIASQCVHPTSTTRVPSISLFQQECTPSTGAPLQDWREHLKSELEIQDTYQRDSIIRSIARICHDLETRCETVEEPLRRETEKSQALEAELSDLRHKLAAVEEKRVDDGLCIEGLEADNARLDEEKIHLLNELDQLRADLDQTSANAERTLRAAQESYNTREAQLRSKILNQEEVIGSRKKEVDELLEAARSLTEKLAEEEQKCRELNDDRDNLQVKLRNNDDQLENHRDTISKQREETSRLNSEIAHLEKRLQDTESALLATTERLSDLQACHHELVQSSSKNLHEAKLKYENEMKEAASKAASDADQINSKLKDALHDVEEMKNAYEDCHDKLQQLQATIPSIKAMIQELNNSLQEKDFELEKFQSWKNNLLATIPDREPHGSRPSHQHRRRKSAIRTHDAGPQMSQCITSTAIMDVANASFASSDSQSSENGPNPKRHKSHTSFKIPAMHTPYSKKLVLKKVLSPKRPALKDMSPNRRHTTVGFDTLINEAECDRKQSLPLRERRSSLQETEQADFDVDDFLAGTPFTPGAHLISGTGRSPEDDASTTEL